MSVIKECNTNMSKNLKEKVVSDPLFDIILNQHLGKNTCS